MRIKKTLAALMIGGAVAASLGLAQPAMAASNEATSASTWYDGTAIYFTNEQTCNEYAQKHAKEFDGPLVCSGYGVGWNAWQLFIKRG
jgi:hypothetical protein